jgi:membrane fusion protein (multidrug efflux system)
MKKNIVVGVLIVFGAALVLGGIKALQIKAMIDFGKAASYPPESVSTAVATEEQWPESLAAVGSITAEQGVVVAPEIAGTVVEIAFESGATVKPGDLLVRLDATTETAQLRAAEAQAELARLNAERSRKLRGENAVSQSELDAAEAGLKQAQANADAIRATIDKKTIRAPFGGQLGIRLVNLGEQVAAGHGLVSLQSLTPAFADFSLPQQDLEKLTPGLSVRVTSDTYPGKIFEGKIAALNPDLDAATRSVRVRALMPNADRLLRPGMFVRVEAVLPGNATVVAIPASAVISAPYGDSVFVVESQAQKDGKSALVAVQKFIKPGRAQGDFVSVSSGLNKGDKVVAAGAFKLHSGTPVKESSAAAPKPSLTPTPPNT